MTSPTLAPPPPAAPRAPARPPVVRPPAPRWDSNRAHRRVLIASLVVSVLLHLLLLVVSPAFLRIGLPPGETDTPFDPATAGGLRMVAPEAITPSLAAPAAPREQVATSAPPVAPRAVRPVPASAAPPSPAPARRAPDAASSVRGDANADRTNPLQPGFRDPRLYVTPREIPPPREPTDHERYMAHLQSRLDAYNDSIGAEAERARKATDWTVKDKDGNRWGVSPGKVHLGGVTLPLPVTLGSGDNATRMREEEQQRQRREIQRQEDDRERDRVAKERTRATRERKDAERKKKPGG